MRRADMATGEIMNKEKGKMNNILRVRGAAS
jgi:hypothetical protein